jgi:hypothetical protein
MIMLTLQAGGVRTLNFRPLVYRLLGPLGLIVSGGVPKTRRWKAELAKVMPTA